ncbi:MAG: hypothetical protein R3E56_15760 [Burkholderiaceae bacterium]
MIIAVAAGLDLLAALVHLGIIAGGPAWYRFFGAGEDLARMAERGHPWPTIVTTAIAAGLAGFALYTWSLSGRCCQTLPWQREVVWGITCLYALRTAVPLLLAPWVTSLRTPFMLVSSLVCGAYAVTHALVLL